MDATGAQPDIEPEIAEYPEAGPFWVGLWAVARHWVALLDQIFEPDVLATTGVTRSFALRCCKWLWSVEGLVRRLIIAAAMQLDHVRLARLTKGKQTLSKPCRPASASVPFTVLPGVPSGRRPHAPDASRTPKTLPEHRHLAFPGDALLRLLPRHDRRNARPAGVRTTNPLKRRGRRSRWDPDYCGPQSQGARRRRGGERAGLRQHPDRSSRSLRPGPGPCAGDRPEWKRIELEWARVLPAPRLAGRIRALIRVMQHPERWVARTALRLHEDAVLVRRLRNLPPPALRKPRLDRGAAPPLDDELAWAHACVAPDTS